MHIYTASAAALAVRVGSATGPQLSLLELSSATAPPTSTCGPRTFTTEVVKNAKKLVTRVSAGGISDDGSDSMASSRSSGPRLSAEEVAGHAQALKQRQTERLKDLDDEYQLLEKARVLQKEGKRTVKATLSSGRVVTEELKAVIGETRMSDVADQLEAHSAMLSPALQQRLGVAEDVAHDPNNPINRSIDKSVKMFRQLSTNMDDRSTNTNAWGQTQRGTSGSSRKGAAPRAFSLAPVACQESVTLAVRQVYNAMDTDGRSQLNAVQLRHGLFVQVFQGSKLMHSEAEALSPAQTYTMFGRMDTEMVGFVSREGFEQYAVAQVGGRLADIAEMLLGDPSTLVDAQRLPAVLEEEVAILLIGAILD